MGVLFTYTVRTLFTSPRDAIHRQRHATPCLPTSRDATYPWEPTSGHATPGFYLSMGDTIPKWPTPGPHNPTHPTHPTWTPTYILRSPSASKHPHIHTMSKIIFENRVFVKTLHLTSGSANGAKLLPGTDFEVPKERTYYPAEITNMEISHCANALVCGIGSLVCSRGLW